MSSVNKRIGGSERARVARMELLSIFSNKDSNESLLKDIEYARRFNVTRHTISSIRDQFEVPPRSERILNRLKATHTEDMTLAEISDALGIKYQNLYKIVKENEIAVKPDVKPIEHLKKHAKKRKQKTLDLIQNSGILTDLEKQLEDIDIIQPPEITRGKGF
jgi:hypothetical protein